MECMHDNLRGRDYYHPTSEGREKLLAERLEDIKQKREETRQSRPSAEDSKPPKGKKRSD